MIHSAQEFIELRQSKDPAEYLRAANEDASEDTWLQVIHQFPEMTIWVVRNKTVPISILELLAKSPSSQVRAAVATKNKLTYALFEALSQDTDDFTRERVAFNKNTPDDVLARLTSDPIQRISERARRELARKNEK